MRVKRGQEFVIGGYTPGPKNFDALIFGYYEGDLIYVARTRNGFTPATREKLFQRLRAVETTQCPFANLPETKSGRWGFGLTAAKMSECRWLKTKLVGQFEFTEWTPDNHLRHTRFVGFASIRMHPTNTGRQKSILTNACTQFPRCPLDGKVPESKRPNSLARRARTKACFFGPMLLLAPNSLPRRSGNTSRGSIATGPISRL